MAFAAFADAPVDVAVVEVGLGGRWDATNVIDAPVAVITPIGLDHTDYLGDTIAEIAGEKAGHHRQAGRRLISSPTRHRRRDRAAGCRRRWRCCWRRRCGPMPRWRVRIRSSRCSAGRSPSAVSCSSCRGSAGSTPRSSCRCTASIRRTTPSLALAAVEAFFGAGADRQLDIDAVRAGFAAGHQPRPAGADAQRANGIHRCRAQPRRRGGAGRRRWHEEFDFRFLVGVVSVMADKDVDGILAALEPAFDQIVVTHNGSPRAMEVDALAMRGRGTVRPGPGDHRGDAARRHRDRDRARRGGRRDDDGASPEAAS